MTTFQTLMFAATFALCGFTFGILVSEFKFVRPMRKLLNSAQKGWLGSLDLASNAIDEMNRMGKEVAAIQKIVDQLPVKSPIQMKHE